MTEIVPMLPRKAPELLAKKVYSHPFLVRVGKALAWATGSALFAYGIGWTMLTVANPVMVPMIYITVVISFVSIFLMTFLVDMSKPTVTLEEIWYRKRLDEARHRDTRVAQLNADHVLLVDAAESLYQSVGKEAFARLKDIDIINHAVELARKKTVD